MAKEVQRKTKDITAPASPVDANATWHAPRPAVLPRPTYWPAVLAFGVVFLLWGLIASPIVSITGLLVAVIALIGWVHEILHEEPEPEEAPHDRRS